MPTEEEIRKKVMLEWARQGGKARWRNARRHGKKMSEETRTLLIRSNKRKELIRWPSFDMKCALCHKVTLEKHRAGAATKSLKKHGSHKVVCDACAEKLDAKLARS